MMGIDYSNVRPTVADQLAFDALDEETKRVCIAMIALEMDEVGDPEVEYERGYEDGKKEGQREAREEFEQARQEFEREFESGLERVEQAISALRAA